MSFVMKDMYTHSQAQHCRSGRSRRGRGRSRHLIISSHECNITIVDMEDHGRELVVHHSRSILFPEVQLSECGSTRKALLEFNQACGETTCTKIDGMYV